MRKFINRLPIAKIKLIIAGLLYRMVHLIYRRNERIIVRNGIKYEVDLSEGIDLSIFLFGKFQKHVFGSKRLSLPEDAVIFDVGANCGAMSLQYAKLAPSGKVYSFEPTHYALSKLKKNLELNPQLAKRIVVIQSFVSSSTSQETSIKAYASWKVGGRAEGVKHSVHGGTTKDTGGIGAVALDDFCEEKQIERLDFIKIDTDGHEWEVIKGARKIIAKFRPAIIFEIGLYAMDEENISFADYSEFFESMDYSLFNSKSLKEINADNYRKHIPSKGTIDILALFRTSHEDN